MMLMSGFWFGDADTSPIFFSVFSCGDAAPMAGLLSSCSGCGKVRTVPARTAPGCSAKHSSMIGGIFPSHGPLAGTSSIKPLHGFCFLFRAKREIFGLGENSRRIRSLASPGMMERLFRAMGFWFRPGRVGKDEEDKVSGILILGRNSANALHKPDRLPAGRRGSGLFR